MIGSSPTVAAHWATPLGLVFIDGGHAFDVALADYEGWARFVVPGGLLVFHDVFEDPADGGQAPFEVWQHAAVVRRLHPRVDHRQPPRPPPPPDRTGVAAAYATVADAESERGQRCGRGRAFAFDLDAGGEELVGGEALGQALAAEQARGRAGAGERVGGEHDRGRVPGGLLDGVELAVERGRRSSSKLAPVQ